MPLRMFFFVFLVIAAVFTGNEIRSEDCASPGFPSAGVLFAQVFPDPSMRGYTPSQIKAVMNFKVTPLISSRSE